MIKQPSCNQEMYEKIRGRGFERFPERKENYDKFLRHMRAGFTSSTLDYMPVKMDYEVSSICNFRCSMCLMGQLSDKRPPNMTFEDFKASLDEQYGLIEVKLQGLGEPLLNKDFFKMAELVVQRDIWARTSTNASLLHVNDNYKKMIDVGLGEIQISIDGATKNTFEKIRVGADFDRIVENVKLINDYARSKGEEWKTSCWMLVQKENAHEMEGTLRLAASLGFTRFVYQMSLNDCGNDELGNVNRGNTVNQSIDAKEKDRLTELGTSLGIAAGFWDNDGRLAVGEVCLWPYSRGYITADMELTPCCLYWDKEPCHMGGARNFKNTWNSDAYLQMRNSLSSGDIPNICKRCYGIQTS